MSESILDMQRITLTEDDLADLKDGASITTITEDGTEVSIFPPENEDA